MRALALSLATSSVLFAAAALQAAPGCSTLTPITDAMINLRDTTYSGVLDKAQTKQRNAIVKALDAIEGGTGGFEIEARTASKVSKILYKAFACKGAGVCGGNPLEGSLEDLFVGLAGEGNSRVQEIEAEIPNLSPRGAARVQKLMDQAQVLLDSIGALQGPDFSVLAKLAKVCDKAQKIIDKDPGI